jgi:hypothetical protein
MPQPFLGSPFRAFPSQRARTPLEATTPLQLSTRVQERTARDFVTASFADAHAFTQLPGSPDDYRLPFRKLDCSLPGCPESQAVKPPHSASFTCFEVFLPLRIRSR